MASNGHGESLILDIYGIGKNQNILWYAEFA